MGSISQESPARANYLPDEIILQVLAYVESFGRQSDLAHFCLVSRQWYNIGIASLYREPVLVGKAYDLFVRALCPSLNIHVKKSDLAGLVKVLDLSRIVHQGNKATTARLLNRTKPSLERFVAPQASFGINCWAALSKCKNLQELDLSLVFTNISFQELGHNVSKLPNLRRLYFHRCSAQDEDLSGSTITPWRWPQEMQHIQFSGKISGPIINGILCDSPYSPTHLTSLSFSHCAVLTHTDILSAVSLNAETLTHLEVRDVPIVQEGQLNTILEYAPHLKSLTIAMEYINVSFGVPDDFDHTKRYASKPLETLALVTNERSSGHSPMFFGTDDMYLLVTARMLGRLRYVSLEGAVGWSEEDREWAVDILNDLDSDNWDDRLWHYEQFKGKYEGMSWQDWMETDIGKQMAPRFTVVDHSYV